MSDDSPRLILEITDKLFVLNIEHNARREHSTPVRHESRVGPIMATQLGKIVGLGLSLCKQREKTGETGIDRVTVDVDDTRIGQCQVDETDQRPILR